MSRKHVWLIFALTALPLASSSAQQKPFAAPIVPAANWRQMDSQSMPDSAVSGFGGIANVEQEYGVKTLELRTYQLGKTRSQVVVEATPDATSAYGLLTFYETPEMAPEKDIQLAAGDAKETIMARGANFIRFLRATASLSNSDFHALLIFVGGNKPSANAIKSLPAPMPSQGLLPASEKYLLGLEAAKRVLPSFRTDLIGFEQGAEVQLAQYKVDKRASTLVSISYPTPQIARVRFGSLNHFLSLNQDHGLGSIYGKRHGTFVFLALNAADASSGTELLNRFDVTQGVSWDQKYTSERSFTMQLVHMILAILVLTALLIGGCVVAGVLFFLSRRFAAKFFPESQWGHGDEEQLIRLNLKLQ